MTSSSDPSTNAAQDREIADEEFASVEAKQIVNEKNKGSSLRDYLLAKFQKVLGKEEDFIPAGELHQVLTDAAIERELRSNGLEDCFSFVSQHPKKIFAILLITSKLNTLRDSKEAGLGDEILPLEDTAMQLPEDEKLRYVFAVWDFGTRKQVIELRWALLAPIFVEGQHQRLDDNARLSFISTTPITNGAYGGVHTLEIHAHHDRFATFCLAPTPSFSTIVCSKQ